MRSKTSAKTKPGQGMLAFGLGEATLAEKRALLYRVVEKLELSLAARELLVWILNVEHDNGGPLRKTYSDLGARPRGLICSAQSTRRLVCQLDELGLLQITVSRDARGQLPNEYRLNWKGIRQQLGITSEDACDVQFGRGDLQNGRPDVQFGRGDDLNGDHIKEYSPSSPPNTPPSTSSNANETTTAVLESDEPMRANREEWIEEAYRKGVRRAELAIDRATAAGRDVRGILAHFNSVMMGWERAKRGLILYRRLTESPLGVAADEGWEAFDHPSLVEASRERVRKLEAAAGPELPKAEMNADEHRLGEPQQEIEELTAQVSSMTPEERVLKLLAVFPEAKEFDQGLARKHPRLLALKLLALERRRPP